MLADDMLLDENEPFDALMERCAPTGWLHDSVTSRTRLVNGGHVSNGVMTRGTNGRGACRPFTEPALVHVRTRGDAEGAGLAMVPVASAARAIDVHPRGDAVLTAG